MLYYNHGAGVETSVTDTKPHRHYGVNMKGVVIMTTLKNILFEHQVERAIDSAFDKTGSLVCWSASQNRGTFQFDDGEDGYSIIGQIALTQNTSEILGTKQIVFQIYDMAHFEDGHFVPDEDQTIAVDLEDFIF